MRHAEGIVTGQQVSSELLECAKQLRSHMTPQEKILWGHLRANRTKGFHFRRQQIINGYVVDFYCHAANLVIEIDGPIHLSQQEYDHERDQFLRSRGLTVLRFTNDEVTDHLERVLDQIRSFIQEVT